MRTTKDELRVILNSMNELNGTNLVLGRRNGYYVIENELPSTGAETLASGLSLREAYYYARGLQRGTWTISTASVKC